MHVVATAGHVDHGKSTLVRALTGREPDRWAEERRRGLTIGLGFAWTTLPGGDPVALVDVPGHERFVPTMLAGVGPVPAVLFVVAADQGWQPQSAEHLAALDALGVRHGLLVITRCDLADPGPASEQAQVQLRRTSLRDIPVVHVSATAGTGLDELRHALGRLCAGLPEPDVQADVRLWIDRSFSLRGVGTVVTGTLAAGTIRVGDALSHQVRGLQSMEQDADEVRAVTRVAVNLRGVDRDEVQAGDALTTPGAWTRAAEIDVALAVETQRELHLHIGSADVAVTVRRLGPHSARLRLARPLPLRIGDRVLLRDPGLRVIVAGADVLDLHPPGLVRRGDAVRRDAELAELIGQPLSVVAERLLHRVGFMAESQFRVHGLPVTGTRVGAWRAHPDRWARLVERVPTVVDRWLDENPLRVNGIPVDAVAGELELPSGVAARLVQAAGLPIVDGHVPGRARLPRAVELALAALTADLAGAPFAAPTADRLDELGLGRRELAAAHAADRILLLPGGIVLLPGAQRRAAEILAALPQPFTVSQARRALDTSRRVALPLLGLLDQTGVTERLDGDLRRTVTAVAPRR
ncbi:selenocysteine-specific translation elongation factor [Kibdelosporangium phytohabitans]|uniref:Translation elongation factor n=1 Tax=Kibdelosporangium phytohabitans TaxID=860235 RepID=A0A0N9I3M9_9PSEU|nr:selenocysteine-specific translation elongation factor [Kibdelosporangium phytohabitans]ALG10669.1 translation elongation factor [Kibdelosporangium phytohabitans]MBE1461796.1 selenocysteine-specific elongation factor [Kibdelosporangium phytohabitans]